MRCCALHACDLCRNAADAVEAGSVARQPPIGARSGVHFPVPADTLQRAQDACGANNLHLARSALGRPAGADVRRAPPGATIIVYTAAMRAHVEQAVRSAGRDDRSSASRTHRPRRAGPDFAHERRQACDAAQHCGRVHLSRFAARSVQPINEHHIAHSPIGAHHARTGLVVLRCQRHDIRLGQPAFHSASRAPRSSHR